MYMITQPIRCLPHTAVLHHLKNAPRVGSQVSHFQQW